jgi:cell division protein FtsQ
MARPRAGRSPIGRFVHALDPATAPLSKPARPVRPRRPPRPRYAGGTGAGVLTRAARPLRALGVPFEALRRRRRMRLVVLVALLALPLLWLGWRWFRDSSFVSVERVRVSGVHGPEAHAIDAALVGAARRMSTLHVRESALHAAVAPFRVVSEVHASASFPHDLSIRVVEQLPVAALASGGVRTAVAADGVVLGPALLSPSLPTLQVGFVPGPGRRVSGASLLPSLTVLGAAPAVLAARVAAVGSGPKGLVVTMQGGLQVYFGDASRPHAKWFSLARVLADPSSSGASYIDVRLPSRPAAGFPGGVAPASAEASGSEGATRQRGGEPTSPVGSLAAGLAGAGPASSKPGEEQGQSPSGAAAPSGEAGSSPSEAGSSAGGESAAGAPAEGG